MNSRTPWNKNLAPMGAGPACFKKESKMSQERWEVVGLRIDKKN